MLPNSEYARRRWKKRDRDGKEHGGHKPAKAPPLYEGAGG
jgi:hypothetical protein